jgi:hypothetical protein
VLLVQVTFMPGLEGLKSRMEASRKSKESKQAETVWDTYLRRKKEKAKMRKVRNWCVCARKSVRKRVCVKERVQKRV